jgi:hypothetical protein
MFEAIAILNWIGNYKNLNFKDQSCKSSLLVAIYYVNS